MLHCKAQLAVLYSSLTLFGLLIHTDNDILHWICLADILLIPYQRTGCSVLWFSISAADGGKSLGLPVRSVPLAACLLLVHIPIMGVPFIMELPRELYAQISSG